MKIGKSSGKGGNAEARQNITTEQTPHSLQRMFGPRYANRASAFIILLHKKGDSDDVENYRPKFISISLR